MGVRERDNEESERERVRIFKNLTHKLVRRNSSTSCSRNGHEFGSGRRQDSKNSASEKKSTSRNVSGRTERPLQPEEDSLGEQHLRAGLQRGRVQQRQLRPHGGQERRGVGQRRRAASPEDVAHEVGYVRPPPAMQVRLPPGGADGQEDARK